jgi:hypothetical protein
MGYRSSFKEDWFKYFFKNSVLSMINQSSLNEDLYPIVKDICENVRLHGDDALRNYNLRKYPLRWGIGLHLRKIGLNTFSKIAFYL